MKLKAPPPVRVHSDRGENVRIGLVRQPVLIFGILVVPERTFTVAESRGRSKKSFRRQEPRPAVSSARSYVPYTARCPGRAV